MIWESYKTNFLIESRKQNISNDLIEDYLVYAKNLFNHQLPIIFDQIHFSKLLGINCEYLHRMSNAPRFFYRTFYIPKKNGEKRRIDEPLADLKRVQRWILEEILYNIPCNKFAKAYVPKTCIKENAQFHINQRIVLTIDLKEFFSSIKSNHILYIFLQAGYNLPVSVLLTKLCCFKSSLPQGAPTSAYLSNLVMKRFDENIGQYCINHNIRYTRYADDLTFSGNFSVAQLLNLLDYELKHLNLKRNKKKFKVMRTGRRQSVTGIIVNDKLQVSREYRMEIRKELYYISKFGLDSHLSHIKETRSNYLQHIIGKINYALFINPKDVKMREYLEVVKKFI